MKIMHVVGARPNFAKVAPLMRALEGARTAQVLVHTGQHYDDAMSGLFLKDLGMPPPDHHLGVGSGTHAAQTAHVMLGFEGVLAREGPDLVVVVGDVNSTLAAALVCAKTGIPLAHVEAGLRSFDRAMPEEINRELTDRLAELLFAPSVDAVENLRREGIADERIYLVGNLMIDSLYFILPRAKVSTLPSQLGLHEGGYAVVTIHRPGNVDSAGSLTAVVDVLEVLQERLPVVFPVHPRTAARLADEHIQQRLRSFTQLTLTEPLSYADFIGLMMHARVVLTDSGGVQEETTVLGIPCLTLRPHTERPITAELGTNLLVGLDSERVLQEIEGVLAGRGKRGGRPELWDGKAAPRAARVITEWLASQRRRESTKLR
jgi:UDP-N-acetylglucosamine 2-epimerase (non-hydrolysing)